MIRYFLTMATIASCLTSLFLAPAADATPLETTGENLISQIFFSGSSSVTTIVTPSLVTETTTSPVIIYRSGFGSSVVNEYFQPSYYYHRYHDRFRQPTVILQQQNIIYPPAFSHSTCTTSIVGSPIPSPVPLDSRTGQLCR
jgi:hypothetical protein